MPTKRLEITNITAREHSLQNVISPTPLKPFQSQQDTTRGMLNQIHSHSYSFDFHITKQAK